MRAALGLMSSVVIVGSAPTVTFSSRDAGSAAGGTVIRLTGTNFVIGATTPKVNGVNATAVNVINSTTLDCTVPAYGGSAAVTGTLVDITVTTASGTGTLVNGFEYYPAPTLTHFAHDFEDGTLGGIPTDTFGGSTVLPVTFGGVKCAECKAVGSNLATFRYEFPAGAHSNPAYEDGRYFQRFKMLVPSATIAALLGVHYQAKLCLLRVNTGSGQPGFAMLGIGTDFPPGDGSLCNQDDFSTGGAYQHQNVTTFGDAVWRELQVANFRGAGVGRVKLYVDGKRKSDDSAAGIGADDAALRYYAYAGFAVVQQLAGNSIYCYVDDLAGKDGWIDP